MTACFKLWKALQTRLKNCAPGGAMPLLNPTRITDLGLMSQEIRK